MKRLPGNQCGGWLYRDEDLDLRCVTCARTPFLTRHPSEADKAEARRYNIPAPDIPLTLEEKEWLAAFAED